MRWIVLFSVLVLGVLSAELKRTDSLSSSLASKKRQSPPENDDFVIYWSDQDVDGYRKATFDDITTEAFVNQYNNGGIYFNLEEDFYSGQLSCSLSVTDGFLLYPKSDPTQSNLLTLFVHEHFGCGLYQVNATGHFETWPTNWCSTTYNSNIFALLSVSFMQDNFYTATEKCDKKNTDITMAIFIRDVIPTPSPSPTPPPAPSSGYICCGYYDYSEHFETDFCQLAGKNCPDSIDSFVSIGNYTVSDCKECCGKSFKK